MHAVYHASLMSTCRFRWFLNDLGLTELNLVETRYTWFNERVSPTLVRIDRAFFMADWEVIFPDSLLQSAAAMLSDHCLLLGLHDNPSGKHWFHFESFWTDLDGFIDTVKTSWEQPVYRCPRLTSNSSTWASAAELESMPSGQYQVAARNPAATSNCPGHMGFIPGWAVAEAKTQAALPGASS